MDRKVDSIRDREADTEIGRKSGAYRVMKIKEKKSCSCVHEVKAWNIIYVHFSRSQKAYT